MAAGSRPPLLIVNGPWRPWMVDVTLCAFVLTLCGGLGFASLAYGKRGGPLMTPEAVGAGVCAILAGVSKWLHGVARRRSWRVEFHDDEVRFLGRAGATPRVTVPWSDIAWFADGEADCVQLKLKGPVSSLIDLMVPTRTEASRTEVLALLDRRGVRRRD